MTRKHLAIAVLGAWIALLAVVGNASANTGYGFAEDPWGSACTYCRVDIYNATTGAWGSTITDGSGTYHATMVANDGYEFRVDTCKAFNRYLGPLSHFVYGFSNTLPTIGSQGVGAC